MKIKGSTFLNLIRQCLRTISGYKEIIRFAKKIAEITARQIRTSVWHSLQDMLNPEIRFARLGQEESARKPPRAGKENIVAVSN